MLGTTKMATHPITCLLSPTDSQTAFCTLCPTSRLTSCFIVVVLRLLFAMWSSKTKFYDFSVLKHLFVTVRVTL